MSTYAKVELMCDPVEIEGDDRHIVMEYALCVTVHHEGTGTVIATNTEVIHLGWREGDEKPSLVFVKTESAESLINNTDVLAELKAGVAHYKALKKEMN